MPERRPNRNERQRRLSDAHAARQYIKVKCGLCHSPTRHYSPADLMRLLGDVPILSLCNEMKCEKCGHKEYLDIDVLSASAAERASFKLRRLVEVKVRKVPVWRED